MTGKAIKGELVDRNRFEPWMRDKMLEVADAGGHVPDLCCALGISSKDTFYRWKRESPELEAAYQEYKLRAERFLDKTGLMGMLGQIKGFDSKIWELVYRNKNPERFAHTNKDNTTNININSNNSYNNLEQLEGKIKHLATRMRMEGLEILGQSTGQSQTGDEEGAIDPSDSTE